MYFPHGVTPAAICLNLAEDALELGATHVRVDNVDNWRIVSADVDWLRLPQHRLVPLDRLFVGMHVHPSRVNGIRSEIFVGAFAVAAYVAAPGEVNAVVGSLVLPETVARSFCPLGCVRSVGFIMGAS
jgi:hypothetical protein